MIGFAKVPRGIIVWMEKNKRASITNSSKIIERKAKSQSIFRIKAFGILTPRLFTDVRSTTLNPKAEKNGSAVLLTYAKSVFNSNKAASSQLRAIKHRPIPCRGYKPDTKK